MAAYDPKARGKAILAAGVGLLGVLTSMAVIFPHIDPTYVIADDVVADASPFMPADLAPLPPHPLSIAVLPVEPEPGYKVPEPVVEQLARDVAGELGGLGMRVADERAAQSLRGRKTPHHEQGRVLGVRYVLAATVAGNEGDEFRVHATLTDCSTKRVLWKGTFWSRRSSGGTFEEAELAAALRSVLPLNQFKQADEF